MRSKDGLSLISTQILRKLTFEGEVLFYERSK